jgi:hypothetical protein
LAEAGVERLFSLDSDSNGILHDDEEEDEDATGFGVVRGTVFGVEVETIVFGVAAGTATGDVNATFLLEAV